MCGPVAHMSGEPDRAVLVVLRKTSWPVLMAFILIVAAFTRDRACFDRLNLLPSVAQTASLAWVIGGMYLSGYCWIVLAYAVTVRQTGSLLPPLAQARALWGRTWSRVVLLLVVLVVDSTPPSLLSAIARLLKVCSGV